MSRNRLVIAVLMLLASMSYRAPGAPAPISAAPTTQPFTSVREVQELSDVVFQMNDAPAVSTAVLDEARQEVREPVVIPFPTTFWTGLTTLVGVAGFYMKRRLYR